MGIVRADIGIKNPRLPESPPLTVRMLADSGSVHLCLPESLRALAVNPKSPDSGISIAKSGGGF